ncbi:MAG: radical SAM protein, partial [Muribaculaceae bacterium]|nr:radical SAM protein [Muribaculaceae bacterium]
PMYSDQSIVPRAKKIKEAGYSIWCYTGFTFEEIMERGTEHMRELLRLTDVLVDGPFIAALRDTTLLFRGSSNQRLIDVPKTMSDGHIILFEK